MPATVLLSQVTVGLLALGLVLLAAFFIAWHVRSLARARTEEREAAQARWSVAQAAEE